jgi:hypothetical protein
LFCNVLGQLHFGLEEAQHTAFCEAFRRRVYPELQRRPWASFHDRWSLEGAEHPLVASASFDAWPNDRELARAFLGERGPTLTVQDHDVQRLFPDDLPRRYIAWPLTPDALHIVEALPAH